MIACVDVDYQDTEASAACLVFQDWPDDQSLEEVVVPIRGVEPYEPGQFFRRELPCVLAALDAIHAQPEVVVIDGYVWLEDESHPGLGAHLFEAMGKRAAVVGVAKTRFLGAGAAGEVLRGASINPLFITAAGMDPVESARRVQSMHGAYRIPTLLRRVDQLCRGLIVPRT